MRFTDYMALTEQVAANLDSMPADIRDRAYIVIDSNFKAVRVNIHSAAGYEWLASVTGTPVIKWYGDDADPQASIEHTFNDGSIWSAIVRRSQWDARLMQEAA